MGRKTKPVAKGTDLEIEKKERKKSRKEIKPEIKKKLKKGRRKKN